MAYLDQLKASLRTVSLRAATNLVGVGALSLLAMTSVGCGNRKSTVACSTKQDCITLVGVNINDGGSFASTSVGYDGGIDVGAAIDCISNICVVQTFSCDTCYRDITSYPDVGACSTVTSCKADMATGDLSAIPFTPTPDMMSVGDGG